MADTTTTNYGLVKPEVGASADTWGNKLNADLDSIDSLVKTANDAIATKAAKGANSDITSLSALQSINGGPLAGLKNRIINGNFTVNQRGVSGTVTLAAGAYGHDRWKAGASGCTYTFSTTNNVTTLTITAGSLQQVIEGLNINTGVHVLSWSGTAQGRINAGTFGTSGAVTASLTGGTNATVEFNTGTLTAAQLEPGIVSTSFENSRPIGLELSLCQRYYENDVPVFARGTVAVANLFIETPGIFKVSKRVAPTLTAGGAISAGNALAETVGTITTEGFRYSLQASVANTDTYVIGRIYRANAEL